METIEMMPARVKIAAILKKAIYAGEYKGGDELSLTEVAARLGVSRTPVREAFLSLEAEGLITLRMNRGAIVRDIDAKFIRDHFEMRELLEGEAAFRAAQRRLDVADLLTRVQEFSSRPADPAEYTALNQDIHLAVWKGADNERLLAYLLELWNGPSHKADPAAQAEHYQKSTREHLLLLAAIQEGDAEKARNIMHSHIHRSMENLLGGE